jgi:hypothetical protein
MNNLQLSSLEDFPDIFFNLSTIEYLDLAENHFAFKAQLYTRAMAMIIQDLKLITSFLTLRNISKVILI